MLVDLYEPALRGNLAAAGFIGVAQWGLQQSDDPTLRNLENAGRLPDGFCNRSR